MKFTIYLQKKATPEDVAIFFYFKKQAIVNPLGKPDIELLIPQLYYYDV